MLGLAMVGCTKENGNYARIGEPVKFGASTQYRNMLGTRTAYSGDVTNSIERIDWLNTDVIRIYSPQATRESAGNTVHWADYQINGFSSDTDHSRASVQVVQDKPLVWAEDGSQVFYSVYPSPGTEEGAGTELDGIAGEFTGAIPATQQMTWSTDAQGNVTGKPDMDLAYMVARRTSSPTADNLEIDFKPVINTFMFTLKSDLEITVKAFELVSTTCPLSGDFSVKVASDTEVDQLTSEAVSVTEKPEFSAGTNDKISVTFPEGGVALSTSNPVVFTVFTIPQDVTDLSINIILPDNSVKTLKLNKKADNKPVSFQTFLKANITAGPHEGDWTYVLVDTSVTASGQDVDGVYDGSQIDDWNTND